MALLCSHRKGQVTECRQTSVEMVKLLEAAVIPQPHRWAWPCTHVLISPVSRNYEMACLGLLSCLWAQHGNKGEEQARRK